VAEEGSPNLDLKPPFAPVSAAAALQVPQPNPTVRGFGDARLR
jgi:hypothetical protein